VTWSRQRGVAVVVVVVVVVSSVEVCVVSPLVFASPVSPVSRGVKLCWVIAVVSLILVSEGQLPGKLLRAVLLSSMLSVGCGGC
jgi:hypothetical protein